MAEENETIADIIAEMRFHAQQNIDAEKDKPEYGFLTVEGRSIQSYADRLEAAHKREAQSIERIVRDAIIDYNGMYPSAPNDEAERDLRERAARANAWLKQHGFEEEPFHWSKEETPCL